MSKINVCAVEYLNTKPIVYGLSNGSIPHRFDIQYAIPSVCADKLLHAEVDLALIPSIEFSRIRKYRHLDMVPDIGVISHETVRSVELFFYKNLGTIETIAVDHSSRTSVALLEIILREKFDLVPKFIPMPPDLGFMLERADAALIIGDRALELFDAMDNKLDLGEEWSDLTDGLPFVYSFWAGVRGTLLPEDVLTLTQSRDQGLAQIDVIARAHSAQTAKGFEPDFYARYLTEHIQFRMGKPELEGLKEFYSYCFYYGILDEIPELTFFGEDHSILPS